MVMNVIEIWRYDKTNMDVTLIAITETNEEFVLEDQFPRRKRNRQKNVDPHTWKIFMCPLLWSFLLFVITYNANLNGWLR